MKKSHSVVAHGRSPAVSANFVFALTGYVDKCRFNIYGHQALVCSSKCSTSHRKSLNVCKKTSVCELRAESSHKDKYKCNLLFFLHHYIYFTALVHPKKKMFAQQAYNQFIKYRLPKST